MFIEKEFSLTELMVLVLQSVDGDVYQALVEECKPVIYKAIGGRYIAGYDQEDLFQEANIVLLRAIENYQFGSDIRFMPYFSHCLKNHYNSLGRKSLANKRKSLNQAISMDYLAEVSGHEFFLTKLGKQFDPAEKMMAKESYQSYTSSLSKFEMDVFKLYLKNHSLDQIAQELGQDLVKVKSAVYRCNSKLKKSFS